MLTTLKRMPLVLCVLAGFTTLAAEPPPLAPPPLLEVPVPPPPLVNAPTAPTTPPPTAPRAHLGGQRHANQMSREQLMRERDRLNDLRPSALFYIPIGLVLGGGAIAALWGLFTGVDLCLSSCGPFYRGPVGDRLIAGGLIAIAVGVVGLVVLAVMRIKDSRMDAIDETLDQMDEEPAPRAAAFPPSRLPPRPPLSVQLTLAQF